MWILIRYLMCGQYGFWSILSLIVMQRSGWRILCGPTSKKSSMTTSLRRRIITISPFIPPCVDRKASWWRYRFVPMPCMNVVNSVLPPTGATRKGSVMMKVLIARLPGSDSCWNGKMKRPTAATLLPNFAVRYLKIGSMYLPRPAKS
ncbi:hypothetical protein BMS3Bbin11_00735 [bacterium BMS3Bbin11]|nr:hypothetical protein BMS3Bbin11_00735 [bacterium BMS3Bbin11]